MSPNSTGSSSQNYAGVTFFSGPNNTCRSPSIDGNPFRISNIEAEICEDDGGGTVAMVVHDEIPLVQTTADPNDQNDVSGRSVAGSDPGAVQRNRGAARRGSGRR